MAASRAACTGRSTPRSRLVLREARVERRAQRRDVAGSRIPVHVERLDLRAQKVIGAEVPSSARRGPSTLPVKRSIFGSSWTVHHEPPGERRPGPRSQGMGSPGVSSARFRTTRRCCGLLTVTTGPRLAELGNIVPGSFSAQRRSNRCFLSIGIRPVGDIEELKTAINDGLHAISPRTTRPITSSYKRPGSPAMREPNPTVFLFPGLGMIAWGKNKSESRVTAEFYNCAIKVCAAPRSHPQ